MQIDILHPLANLEVVKIHSAGQHQTYKPQQYKVTGVLLFNGTLYVQSRSLLDWGQSETITCAPIDSDLGKTENWTQLPLPEAVGSVLTTYRSRLVLVGGRERCNILNALNDVWTSADGTDWQKSLPPMPTHRFGATIVKSEGPESLVVVGGYRGYCEPVNVVEMLRDGRWSSVRTPLWLFQPNHLISTLHNGNLFVRSYDNCHFCRFDSLLSALSCPNGSDGEDIVWNELPQTIIMANPKEYFALFSFGQQLAALSVGGLDIHSPFTYAWFRVLENFKDCVQLEHGLVLPNGELMILVENDVVCTRLKSMLSKIQ